MGTRRVFQTHGTLLVDETTGALLVESIATGGHTYFSAVVNAGAGAQTEIEGTPGAGKEIWVFGYDLHADAAGSFKLESASTAKTGVCPVGANGGVARDAGQAGCPIFKCAANEALNITTVVCEIDGVVNGFIVDV